MKELHVTLRVRNNRLLARRVALGLSQRQIAETIGTTNTSYCAMENMRVSPLRKDGRPTRPAQALMDFFDAEFDELWPEGVLSVVQPVVTREMDAVEVAMLTAPPTAMTPHELAEVNEQWELVARGMGYLRQREEEIIARRFGLGDREPETLEEISADLGIPRLLVRSIEARAIRKLQVVAARGKSKKQKVHLGNGVCIQFPE